MPADERLTAIKALHDDLLAEGRKDRSFEAAIEPIRADLRAISGHLLMDPSRFRRTRSLHAVHIPSLHTAVRLWAAMDQDRTVAAAERERILTAFRRSAGLFRESREKLGAAVAFDALVEIETLADRAPPLPVETASVAMSGWASRAAGTLRSVTSTEALTGLAGTAWSDITTRMGGFGRLGGSLGRSVSGALRDNLTTPVSVRLAASARAIEAGVTTGAGLGIIIGVLCPPLLPLTAGGAVLAALDSYNDGVRDLTALRGREREERLARLAEERTRALREIAGGASSLQMETEDLSLTLNAETGEVDAMLLSGKYAGRSWSVLSAREREKVLREGRSKSGGDILDILALSAVIA